MLQPRVKAQGAADGQRSAWAHTGRESRHARGYGSEWEKARKRVMRRDAGLCQPCIAQGATTPAHAVDHVVPKFEGGTDDDANLQAICRDCHAVKTADEAKRARGC
jgi:5-methylcytosine-specific restriction protein A